jgi:hypothetical protein
LPGMYRLTTTIELATSEIGPREAVAAPQNFVGRSRRSLSNKGRWPDSPNYQRADLRRFHSPLLFLWMCVTIVFFVLNFTSTWAEDRALRERNPSADPGAKTGDGASTLAPSLFSISGIGTNAINSGGLGAGPQGINTASSAVWNVHCQFPDKPALQICARNVSCACNIFRDTECPGNSRHA